MGKVTRKSDRETETPRPRRKRRKKDLDRIHTKILKAKRKLDNESKSNKNGPERKASTKICNRLLPKSFVGIYRNGAKGKDIRNERSENTVVRARLDGDALKLFNGDTPESKCMVESTIHDKIIKQSPNKKLLKNSLEWTPCVFEHSPVLGKSQNGKLHLVKKKGEETLFESLDSNKVVRQNVNEAKCSVQREDICKRRLFQNEWEQSKNSTSQIQIFSNIDFSKESKINEEKKGQTYLENSNKIYWDPLTRYMELCAKISAENFEADFLKKYDPLTTTVKKLRQAYADSYRRQFLRDKSKRESSKSENSFAQSVEYQACTYSDNSQLSPVEFEVPKYNENHVTVARLQKGLSQKDDEFHSNLLQSSEPKKNRDPTHYSSTSYSSQDTNFIHGTNTSAIDNRENSDKQYTKRVASDLTSFCLVNEKNSVYLNSRVNPKLMSSHPSKDNRRSKEYADNFHIDISGYVNSQCVEKVEHLGTSILPNGSMLSAKRHVSKGLREKLPKKRVDCEIISDNCMPNDTIRKCNNRVTNNTKNIKRIPTILRRCSNFAVNKNNRHVRTSSDQTESLYREPKVNFQFNESPSNGNANQFYDAGFLKAFKNFLTPRVVNVEFDRSRILEPQIESMKIKDSQESRADNCEIQICSDDLSGGTSEFCQFDSPPQPSRAFEATRCKSAYVERLTRQRNVAPNARKYLPQSSNDRAINYLPGTSNFNIEPAKRTESQGGDSCRHACETKQKLFAKCTHDQNQNVFYKSAKDRTVPTSLSFPQNMNVDKKFRVPMCEEILDKLNAECAKSRANQENARRGDESCYVRLDLANCSRKCNVSKACHLHEEKTARAAASSEISRDTNGYENDDTDNCVNLLNGTRNVQLLSLERKHNNPYTKVVDDHGCHAVLLQNVTQPIKYLAVKNGSDIQRIPVYINEGSVGITESAPLKVVALMDANTRAAKAFPQKVTAQVIPLQTAGLQLDDLGTRKKNDPPAFAKHLDSVNAILIDPDGQSNVWYSSNL